MEEECSMSDGEFDREKREFEGLPTDWELPEDATGALLYWLVQYIVNS